MNIGAFQRFSLLEYPGKICAILFTQGCNFRCPYCHNPELVAPDLFQPRLSERDIFDFLEKRRGKLDAVTLTGGEPTQQTDLIPFIQRLKKMGFLVKVDSNGSRPDVLEQLIRLGLVDYIAMDVKGPLHHYAPMSPFAADPEKIRESIALIMSSSVNYEFRTTVVASLLNRDDLLQIAQSITGARLYALQRFVPSKTLDPGYLNKTTFTEEEFEVLKALLQPRVKNLLLR